MCSGKAHPRRMTTFHIRDSGRFFLKKVRWTLYGKRTVRSRTLVRVPELGAYARVFLRSSWLRLRATPAAGAAARGILTACPSTKYKGARFWWLCATPATTRLPSWRLFNVRSNVGTRAPLHVRRKSANSKNAGSPSASYSLSWRMRNSKPCGKGYSIRSSKTASIRNKHKPSWTRSTPSNGRWTLSARTVLPVFGEKRASVSSCPR